MDLTQQIDKEISEKSSGELEREISFMENKKGLIFLAGLEYSGKSIPDRIRFPSGEVYDKNEVRSYLNKETGFELAYRFLSIYSLNSMESERNHSINFWDMSERKQVLEKYSKD